MMAACPNRTISEVIPTQQGAVIKDIPFSADIDILFVIDNSASTADKQAVFSANFPKFVAALDAFPLGGRPNLHIAVVDTTVDIGVQGYAPSCPSPDPNDNGVFQNTPRVAGCQAPTGRFISDIKNSDMTRTVNYSGTLDQALSCIALVGATGCGFEAQLEAAVASALDGSMGRELWLHSGRRVSRDHLLDRDEDDGVGAVIARCSHSRYIGRRPQ